MLRFHGMSSCKGVFILDTSRPRQNGQHFSEDIFECIFLNENVWVWNKIWQKFVPEGPFNNDTTGAEQATNSYLNHL